MNDDRLSAGEQNELRALVTAGAGRMRAARRRRMQAITGGAAVVLVAAVVGAVALTALGSPDRIATPIETTTTPTPTPTLEPQPEPTLDRGAVRPFGGSCDNMLTLPQVSEWMGVEMRQVPARWADPAMTISGGITCIWAVPDAYLWGYTEITVLPAVIFLPSEPPLEQGVCDGRVCRAAAVVDGNWIVIEWTGSPEGAEVDVPSVGPGEFAELFDILGENAAEFPASRPAEPQPSWWAANGCDAIAPRFDHLTASKPNLSGMALLEMPTRASQIAHPQLDACSWVAPDNQSMSIIVIPGGGETYDAIAGSEFALLVDVSGSDGAVAVPNYFVWEGNGVDVVVKSGDNLLIVGNSGMEQTDEMRDWLVAHAAEALAALNATLG
ncbi:hypothetical protein GCM10027058_01570 [Microbacterium neimengense]